MMKVISALSLILVIVGAINWGLWGVFQVDLVASIFGGNTLWAARVVYSVVGLAGIWSLRFLSKMCVLCECGEKK